MAYKNWKSPSEIEYMREEIEKMFGAQYDEKGNVIVPIHHQIED